MGRRFGALLIVAALTRLFGVAVAEAQTLDAARAALSVSGEGIVKGAPDIALITLGVVSEASRRARGALRQQPVDEPHPRRAEGGRHRAARPADVGVFGRADLFAAAARTTTTRSPSSRRSSATACATTSPSASAI